ncbi:NnrS family protein [Vibrio tapetis]|uniref:NnrS family protein n=1 Tax=Vibrio tapetis subsp. tapetis TaxID=1671868 RepID=A0A2N8ZD84_9VIBR|nr:NnrS family protein [Vibrio tapetis]SON49864.1 conserved membrane protein of unknown function [Vibrio tapetis subsp. tapetis]
MPLRANWADFDSELYRCGFRPFFLLTSVYATLLFGFGDLWLSIANTPLSGQALPIESVDIWFVHELVFGVGMCGLSGFLLTAFPAWTGSNKVESKKLGMLVVSWMLARISAWLLPIAGEWPLVMTNLLFITLLLKFLAPSIVERKHRKHRIFYYQLCLLTSVVFIGYYFWLTGNLATTLTLMDTSVGLLIVLLLTVLSRMSMVIVNHAIRRYQVPDVCHVAKPTRRNFAISIILGYLAVNIAMGGGSISGWLALASAAAVLNILNDWHLPKVWRDVYVQLGYSLYILIAVGFSVIGVNAILGQTENMTAMSHVFSGVMSAALLLIMLVVGQKHTGHQLSYSPSIKLMMMLVVLPLVAQFVDLFGLDISFGKSDDIAMVMSFVIYFIVFRSTLASTRIDGKEG